MSKHHRFETEGCRVLYIFDSPAPITEYLLSVGVKYQYMSGQTGMQGERNSAPCITSRLGLPTTYAPSEVRELLLLLCIR